MAPRRGHHAGRTVLLAAPTKTRFEGLVQRDNVKFRLTPQADAPVQDELRLRLTGAGGSTNQTIAITNVPLSTNTAPRCDPVSVARRSDGAAAVPVGFHVLCWDTEHDDYTLYGNGPGSHPDAPKHNAGGTGGQGVPFWHYVPTIASGQEQTTYYAIDVLGARSADAPISVQIGPDVDRLPSCHPNPSGGGGASRPVYSRPGATRRFTIICEDADGDAVMPRVQTPPSRGRLTAFDPQAARAGWWVTASGSTPRTCLRRRTRGQTRSPSRRQGRVARPRRRSTSSSARSRKTTAVAVAGAVAPRRPTRR